MIEYRFLRANWQRRYRLDMPPKKEKIYTCHIKKVKIVQKMGVSINFLSRLDFQGFAFLFETETIKVACLGIKRTSS